MFEGCSEREKKGDGKIFYENEINRGVRERGEKKRRGL
jgi:hypothetical protein